MTTIAIVQARMSSQRLPGKVLLDVAGQTMLERVVRRLHRSRLIDEVVVATSDNPADDQVIAECYRLGVRAMRGDEDDVLARFAGVARVLEPDVCVRVSADSPLVDPQVTDLVISRFLSAQPPVDYASNKLDPSFPLGLDVEVFSRAAIERAANEAKEDFERSHVTAYIYRNPDRFTLLPVVFGRNLYSWRWTVDSPEDLEFARAVFARLGGGNDFSWLEVVELIEREPAIAEINRHVAVKPLEAG